LRGGFYPEYSASQFGPFINVEVLFRALRPHIGQFRVAQLPFYCRYVSFERGVARLLLDRNLVEFFPYAQYYVTLAAVPPGSHLFFANSVKGHGLWGDVSYLALSASALSSSGKLFGRLRWLGERSGMYRPRPLVDLLRSLIWVQTPVATAALPHRWTSLFAFSSCGFSLSYYRGVRALFAS